MQPESATTVPQPSLSPPVIRWLEVIGWLALVVYFHTPIREVMTATLDSSNYASYAYFTAHHFQYGSEVVPMAGPYGFVLYGWVYSGELFWLRTALELLLNAALATLTIYFFRACRNNKVRWLWLAAHIAFTPFHEDLPLEWILLLTGIYLLKAPPKEGLNAWAVAATALLAFVSLIKGTQLVLSLATLGVVLGGHAWLGRWRHVALLSGSFGISLLSWWLLAGQNPINFPAYVRGISELAAGYSEAMSLDEPSSIFLRGLLISALLAVPLAWGAWSHRRDSITLAMLALMAGHTFVQWKHGFVRADGHTHIYFNYALVAAITIYLLATPIPVVRLTRLASTLRVCLLLSAVVVCWATVSGAITPSLTETAMKVVRRFGGTLHYLATLPKFESRFEEQLEKQRALYKLPQTRSLISDHTVDLFGIEHGLIPFNHLNYRPRPMGGGPFNVYTPTLMQMNRDFVRDPTRQPTFYMMRLDSIDGRLVTQDDSQALLQILYHYSPELLEINFLTLRLRPESISPPEPRLIEKRIFRMGETVPVPSVSDEEIVMIRFDLPLSLSGRVRSALYKCPPTFVNLEDVTGHQIRRRLIPAMAREPLILSPFIDSNADLIDLYELTPGKAIRSLTLSNQAPQLFLRELSVEFLVMPRPPKASPEFLGEMRSRVQFPFANRVPQFTTTPFRLHQFLHYLHAPAEIVWSLQGTERVVTFDYGIDPEAYERGDTNGVEFILETRGPSGGATRVFSRMLKPLTETADRGQHTATVQLPVYAPGTSLVFRTDPGDDGNTAWDWAYVTRIELRRGPYLKTQFPGFSRPPDFASGEHTGIVTVEGQEALMLHVPGAIVFDLNGTEKKLTLEFGFLEGAYANGGNTDGAEIIVDSVTPGQSPRKLAQRILKPVTEVGDRGTQRISVALDSLPAGSQLRVHTMAVSGGSSSWGWTYLSRATIE